MFKFGSVFKGLSDQDILLAELAKENSTAIRYILKKVENNCSQSIKKMGLSDDNIQDIMHDGLILFIRKIQDGTYDSTISAPQTFLTGICRNLALNTLKTKKNVRTVEIEDFNHPFANVTQNNFDAKEAQIMVARLLDEIGSPCKELIRLKYIDGYTDEEQIQLKLTSFSGPESLRVSRSQCMKKISVISSKYKKGYEC